MDSLFPLPETPAVAPLRELDDIFSALATSKFRSGFHLKQSERLYVAACGLPMVLEHARGFIAQRLAPALPRNDGKQTPWRGHPVFIAQHATATCCRGCLAKWHGIPRGIALGVPEQNHVIRGIARWLGKELET